MSKEAMKLALLALQSGEYWKGVAAVNALREALAEQPAQQQEPVAWAISYDGKTPYSLWTEGDGALLDLEVRRQGGATCKLPLYTSPPAQRKPLTDEDCTRIYNEANGITIKNPPITTERIFKAMRAAHGIKENT